MAISHAYRDNRLGRIVADAIAGNDIPYEMRVRGLLIIKIIQEMGCKSAREKKSNRNER